MFIGSKNNTASECNFMQINLYNRGIILEREREREKQTYFSTLSNVCARSCARNLQKKNHPSYKGTSQNSKKLLINKNSRGFFRGNNIVISKKSAAIFYHICHCRHFLHLVASIKTDI